MRSSQRLCGVAACLALNACATPTASPEIQRVVYPDDHGIAVPVVRFADPGDLIWLTAQERYVWDLDGLTLTARDPHTNRPVTRRIDHWRVAQEGGGVRYFAPQAFFVAPYYRAEGRGAQTVIVRNGPDIPEMPPPYACVIGDQYWKANLTWRLGRCAKGHPQGQGRQTWATDLRDWREVSVRLVAVRDGKAVFAHRFRTWRDGPQVKETTFSGGPGLAPLPRGLEGEVDVVITAIDGQRVSYRLARRIIPCDGASCVQE